MIILSLHAQLCRIVRRLPDLSRDLFSGLSGRKVPAAVPASTALWLVMRSGEAGC